MTQPAAHPFFVPRALDPADSARNLRVWSVLVVLLLTFTPFAIAQEGEGEPPLDFGVWIDGRYLEAYHLVAHDLEGELALSREELIAVLGDEPLAIEKTVIFAGGEDLGLTGFDLELNRSRLVVQGLAKQLDDGRGPWGLRLTTEIEGLPMTVTLTSQQYLDEHVVVFTPDLFPGGKAGHDDAMMALAEEMAAEHGGTLLQTYTEILGGFSIRIEPEGLAALRKRVEVSWIHASRYVRQMTLQHPMNNWALDRIDDRTLPLNNRYDYGHEGAGVTIFVIDSGIRDTHNDFGNRVTLGTDYVNTQSPHANMNCNHHGTNMASLAAGEKWGVAKQADLVSIRVLDCFGDGDDQDVVAALGEAVTAKTLNPTQPMVALLALSSDLPSLTIDIAARDAVNAGVVVVGSVARRPDGWASNTYDACQGSPGRVAEVISVGASDNDDDRWSESGIGTCVDLFAPGVDAKGAGSTGNNATHRDDGTSAPAAYTAGVAARYLSALPQATPAQTMAAILANTTNGVLGDIGLGSPNRLLFWDERNIPGVVYRSHVKNRGWLSWVANGPTTGTTGESRRAEAFQVELEGLPAGIGVCYDVDSRTQGWTGTACNGQTGGTTGQGLRAERIKIWLTGNTAAGCNISYQAHVENIGWQTPRANGAVAGVDGDRIEALRVWITPQCFLPPPPPTYDPVAVCTAIPNQGQVSVTSTLNGAASYDPDGWIQSYVWDLGNGVTSTSPVLTYTFLGQPNTPVTYPVTLTVEDNLGNKDTAYCPVFVDCLAMGPGLWCTQ